MMPKTEALYQVRFLGLFHKAAQIEMSLDPIFMPFFGA